ncbi:MAG TPA: hypothetical protein VIH88_11225 [Candidatus Acidoferrales bacterium]
MNLGTGVPAVATKIAYITGTTSSANFPVTAGSIPPPGAGVANGVAFVSLLNIVNGALQYSTFLGGSAGDTGFSIASDSAGLAYVAGLTGSAEFPVTQGALQEARTNPKGSRFVSKIGPNGQGLADLVYSTYFTGQVQNTATTQDSVRGIAVSGTNAFITGFMTSPDMLTSAGAFQSALGAPGATNAFVADLPLTPTITITPASNNFGSQLVGTPTAPFFFTITNNTTSAITLPLTIIINATAGNAGDFSAPAAGGTCTVRESLAGGASCKLGVIYTPSAAGSNAATLKTPDSADTPPAPGQPHPLTVGLTGTGSATADYSVSVASISVVKGATGPFPVLVTGSGGFAGSVDFTCVPGTGMLITSCSVPTANLTQASPVATVNGSITAAAFLVPPQSMKMPPSVLLQQVLLIMMAIALLFRLPEARRFRTRLGMAGAMIVFVLVAGCSGGPGAGSKSSTIVITPSSGGVAKPAITVNVTITQ